MTPPPASADLIEPEWQSGKPHPLQSDRAVDVWRWRPAAVSADAQWLSAEERRRALRFPPEKRNQFVATRRAVRYLLAGYLECSPDAIVFGQSPLGRPFVSRPRTAVDFNLSHSGALAVLAVTRGGTVGIDIESRREMRDPLLPARRLFPASWVSALESCPDADRRAFFLVLWTRFEACQKAHGRGIFSAVEHEAEQPAWGFSAGSGHTGHLCLAGPLGRGHPPQFRFFDFAMPD